MYITQPMISKHTALWILPAGLAFLIALFLAGCTNMPLTSMYKLSRMNPMDADPVQILQGIYLT